MEHYVCVLTVCAMVANGEESRTSGRSGRAAQWKAVGVSYCCELSV